MPEEIRFLPGILEKIAASGVVRLDTAMLKIAQRAEAVMKEKAREGGAHQYGTKTTATPGSGPAVISGDLSRSITHQKVPEGYRIGPAAIPHTQYGSRRRSSASKRQSPARNIGSRTTATNGQIGEWLECGTRKMPAYPFVAPAKDAVEKEIELLIKAEFEAPL